MTAQLAFLGFGEAARTFAMAPGWTARACAFDTLIDLPDQAEGLRSACDDAKVEARATASAATSSADLIISVVTADQALMAARSAANGLHEGALYCDFNSVAPGTKQAAAAVIEAAGGQYVDVAVMAPVKPAALSVPLLLSGARAEEAERSLRQCGFDTLRVVGDEIGQAASIKMIRSIMIKGMEALSAECVLAAHRANVLDEVLASLGEGFADQMDYNLDRMLVHGRRRAAEMEEVVRTLSGLGIQPLMTEASVTRQARLGALDMRPVPDGLEAKLAALGAAGGDYSS